MNDFYKYLWVYVLISIGIILCLIAGFNDYQRTFIIGSYMIVIGFFALQFKKYKKYEHK